MLDDNVVLINFCLMINTNFRGILVNVLGNQICGYNPMINYTK